MKMNMGAFCGFCQEDSIDLLWRFWKRFPESRIHTLQQRAEYACLSVIEFIEVFNMAKGFHDKPANYRGRMNTVVYLP